MRMNKKFICFIIAFILAGCDGNGAGEDDGGVQDGTVQDGNKADAGDADTDADTDTDSDSDADADADSDADGDLDAGEDACMYDPEDRVGWVQTWGGDAGVFGTGVAVGPDDSIVVVGDFKGTADFNPGPLGEIHESAISGSSYVSKFDSDGDYLWTKVFKGTWSALASGVAVTQNGSILIGGYFYQTMDFDPGVGVEERTAEPSYNPYILMLDKNGKYEWVIKATSDGSVTLTDLKLSSSENIYIMGDFDQDVVFQTVLGEQEHNTIGEYSVYVAKASSEGEFLWSKSMGSAGLDEGDALDVGPDESVVIIGKFESTMDFDPGAGIDEYTSNDLGDTFLIKLDSDGEYQWGRHIQGPGIEFGRAVAVDDDGNVYAGIEHQGILDLDPDNPGWEADCTDRDCFSIAKYNSSGAYVWTRTITSDHSIDISDIISNSESVVLSGTLIGFADFDPGDAIEWKGRDPGIGANVFLFKLGYDGSYYWTAIIEETGSIFHPYIATSQSNDYYSTGWFMGTVDFDPTACEDNRTAGAGKLNDAFLWKVSEQGTYYK